MTTEEELNKQEADANELHALFLDLSKAIAELDDLEQQTQKLLESL